MFAINAAVCCAGTCLCNLCCCCCKNTSKISPRLAPRIGFIILSIFFAILSILLSFALKFLLTPFASFISCPSSIDNNLNCIGISSVYRMSFALVTLHLIVIIFSLCGKSMLSFINQGCWLLKILIVLGVYIGGMLLSNNIFVIYARITQYTSILFLLYQIIVTVSFAHVLNIKLVDSWSEHEDMGCWYQFLLIFLSLFFLGIIGYLIFDVFFSFPFGAVNSAIILLTVGLGVGVTIVSISNLVNRKRLLTSIYVFSYIVYLAWSAIGVKPGENGKATMGYALINMGIGLAYITLALSFLGFFIKKSSSSIGEGKELENNPLIEKDDSPLQSNNNNEDEGEGRIDYVQTYDASGAHFLFHLFMIFLSMYYCMLLTNWTVNPEANIIFKSWISFWLNLVMIILTVVFYVMIMISPRLFPDREFAFE